MRTISDHNRRLESLPVDFTVEQQHRVPALAQSESVGGDAEDGVHAFEQVRDQVTARDRMNEDRTVEDDVEGQQIGESFGRWLRAAHVLERMTCQANPLSAIETRGYKQSRGVACLTSSEEWWRRVLVRSAVTRQAPSGWQQGGVTIGVR
jgi:hypothetical protein